METFNFIAGLCSILSLGVSLFTATTVIKIKKQFNVTSVTKNRNKICGNKLDNKSKIVGGNEK
ncbi:hypothetical protein D9O40_09030 [Clostridium autoethanogenum]|uniref:Uncharacterized protein n=1 Tax=Clostridium autoethanogenum TaxID=84023 RepID=A0A3M0STP5_9CLOT|nr:hypothetical protein [Clostridium autoethanogenum]RMD01101.1 hypothetical protein D9O40_09030 [Clostridium autoethanogenum]